MGRTGDDGPADARAARLKAALKANMGRRKAQGRAREAARDEDGAPRAREGDSNGG